MTAKRVAEKAVREEIIVDMLTDADTNTLAKAERISQRNEWTVADAESFHKTGVWPNPYRAVVA